MFPYSMGLLKLVLDGTRSFFRNVYRYLPLSTSAVCVGAASKELNTCMLLRTSFLPFKCY